MDYLYVRRMRLELTRRNRHYPLKVACLPISPPGLFKTGRGVRHRTLGACSRNTRFRSANIDRILLSTKFSTDFSEKNPIFVLPNFKVGRSHSGRSGRRRSPARIVPAGGAAPSAGDADRRKPIFETNKNDSPK